MLKQYPSPLNSPGALVPLHTTQTSRMNRHRKKEKKAPRLVQGKKPVEGLYA